MLDIGWSELLVIGVVALIVIGPKDLPHLFHSLGRFTAKARSMAREFSSAMEDAAKGSGLDEAAGSIRDLKSLTSKKALGLDALDRAAEKFEKWDPKLPEARARAPQDPGLPPKPPGDGESPASKPSAASTPRDGSVGSGSVTAAATASDMSTGGETETGKRRLHAVRRSDRKDD